MPPNNRISDFGSFAADVNSPNFGDNFVFIEPKYGTTILMSPGRATLHVVIPCTRWTMSPEGNNSSKPYRNDPQFAALGSQQADYHF
jgi:hypothetical protein